MYFVLWGVDDGRLINFLLLFGFVVGIWFVCVYFVLCCWGLLVGFKPFDGFVFMRVLYGFDLLT